MKIAVVGSYGQAITVKMPRQPVLGETILGTTVSLGPGGKGSNQRPGSFAVGEPDVLWGHRLPVAPWAGAGSGDRSD